MEHIHWKKLRNLGIVLAWSLCALAVPAGFAMAADFSAMAANASVTDENGVTTQNAMEVSAAKVRSGLTKVNGKWYYYEKNKRIRKQWRDIWGRSGGKYKWLRYYFQGDGSAVVSDVRFIDKKYYLFNSNGRLIRLGRNRLITMKGNQYVPNVKGECQKGWLWVDGKLYYADGRARIVKNKTIQGIRLGKTGAATDKLVVNLKKETDKVLSSITKSSMSKSQKLAACWDYMVDWRVFRYRNLAANLSETNWQKKFAYNMFISHAGSCESFACAFAALASEIGYDPVIVYGRVPGSRDGAADGFTRHCWVMIDGRYYDPEADFAGWMTGVYGYSYYPISYQIIKTLNFRTGK